MAERSGTVYTSNDDRLPWLEPVDDEDAAPDVSRGRLIGGVLAALIVIGLVVGGLFWIKQRFATQPGGEVALIPAPAGAYKTRPDDPGGMKVEGQGDTAYAASAGADPDAKLDLNALPETPMKGPKPVAVTPPPEVKPAPPPVVAVKPAPEAKPEPVRTAAAKPAATKVAAAKPEPTKVAATKPAATKPAPTKTAAAAIKPAPAATKPTAKPVAVAVAKPSSGGGAGIQLGAFSSQAKAEAAWKSLSGRFASLGSLSKNIVVADKGGATVYRLRASGAGASAACGKLKVAGESCVAVGK